MIVWGSSGADLGSVHCVLLDVVLVGEDDHSSGVTRLHQTFDDLVELSSCRLARNLYRLSNTHPA